ncbi:MAG: hypothetical protein JSR82_17780 [Verrucomicrobia bacterium]|nr:hypothetical protein [Verrucomicrobiota bacterium]
MSRRLFQASLVLFVLACILPALHFRNVTPTGAGALNSQHGGAVLLMGWLSLFVGQTAWLANPCFVLGSILQGVGRRLGARICLALAALLAATTAKLPGAVIPADEAGVNKMQLDSFGPGAWAWFAAIGLGLLAAFLPAPTPPQLPSGPPNLPK